MLVAVAPWAFSVTDPSAGSQHAGDDGKDDEGRGERDQPPDAEDEWPAGHECALPAWLSVSFALLVLSVGRFADPALTG
jgi:hypothetical protein